MDFKGCFVVSVLQTTPSHVIGQLDKLLREVSPVLVPLMMIIQVKEHVLTRNPFLSNQVSTLDGVLEVRNEHFWTVGFGSLVHYQNQKCLTSHLWLLLK